MRRPSVAVSTVLAVIALVLLPAVSNIQANALPASWAPYLWLAWPAGLVLAMPLVYREVRQRRWSSEDHGESAHSGQAQELARDPRVWKSPSGGASAVDDLTCGAAPCQLPADVQHFIGRRIELDALTALLECTEIGGSRVVVSAVNGMAGIGKTALAVHVAHLLAERFPDGQLFLDLHGYTQGYAPRSAAEALDTLLRALGVPPQRVPQDVEERAAFYRQRLAGTRTLIVLDNVADEAQVQPLLPGTPGCLVLVTGRRRLKGLDDTITVPLEVLPQADAITLLRSVAGTQRVPPGDSQLAEIARLCGELPLALRIAGALLRHRPCWSPHQLADKLRTGQAELDAFRNGAQDLAVLFELSYQSLGEDHQRLFRRLGLIPGADTDGYAAAALLDIAHSRAEDLLAELVDHHLLAEPAAGRYRMHDLVRAYARSTVATDSAQECDAAVSRLLDYYQHTASGAAARTARVPRRPPAGPVPAHAPTLDNTESALAWLRSERPNLEAAFDLAVHQGWNDRIVTLSAGLSALGRADDPWFQTHRVHIAATAAARRSGDRAAEAGALTELAHAWNLTGDKKEAIRLIRRALALSDETDDRLGQANALAELGWNQTHIGRYKDAVNTLNRALEIYRSLGNQLGQANALQYLGIVWQLTGDHTDAANVFARSLGLYRALGNHFGQANALSFLGRMQELIGDHESAIELLHQALDLSTKLGNRTGKAIALTFLGCAQHSLGDHEGAVDLLERALELFREIGSRGNEAHALNHQAAALLCLSEVPRALASYREALRLTRDHGQLDDEALALEGVGKCLIRSGRIEEGTALLEQALGVFRRIGMKPDRERVALRLRTDP